MERQELSRAKSAMSSPKSKYRFLLINAFSLSQNSPFKLRSFSGSRESMVYNYENVARYLEDVDWDVHPGAPATHGDWPVELQEEFALVGANRLPIVRAACENGKYNAIILLGGGDPGYWASREIARPYGIPVTSCAHAQMHIASMLGNKFGIVDIHETHNMQMFNLVVQYGFKDRCAGISNLDYPLPRPPFADDRSIEVERDKALRGEKSRMVDRAVEQAVSLIEEDGAEVIILGCSAIYWLQPFLQERLEELGWEAPVLEGIGCAIALAKLFVDLDVSASGLMFPAGRPKKSRAKKHL